MRILGVFAKIAKSVY